MENLLEVEELNKSYPRFALKNLNFTLKTDCITGFIGINGAGKTTTIRTILGLANKDSGSVKFFGKELKDNEMEIKNRVGVVLDGKCFYEQLTIGEMKSVLAPAYTSWDNKCFLDYMERFQLSTRQKISTLSKGMSMKLSLALALSHNADLLIMDEPTGGLDPLVRKQLLTILSNYMEKGGKSIFLSTHITSDLDKLADILILIDQGNILFEEDKDSLLDSYRILKGDQKDLTDDLRHLFLSLQETDYGFTGITDNYQKLKALMNHVTVEKPAIEDLMLAHIERRKMK